jgi:Cytochrome P450
MQVMTCVLHFLLAMMAHPEVLAKAQKEIDRVVGSDRLPTFEDRPFLPYGLCYILLRYIHLTSIIVDAILSETYRLGAPVPLSERVASYSNVTVLADPVDPFHLQGLPHRLMEDDIYRGMYIPKGSMVCCPPVHMYTNTKPVMLTPLSFMAGVWQHLVSELTAPAFVIA